ncbi:MAG: dihydrofolate reductase [Thermodesulfobacteriota bacterium]
MELILIAAMARNRTIGHNNRIPWHIPEEMHYFKETTMGHGVIMGRLTYDSIGFPLPGRFNIVLSRDEDLSIPGCSVVGSLSRAIELCREHGNKKCFIIGGHSLYREGMDLVDTILLSILDSDYEGDTFFPPVPEHSFEMMVEKRMGGEQPFSLHTYRRKEKNP